MKKKNLRNYISNLIILLAISGVMYFVLWLFTPGELTRLDYEVSALIHEGQLEIEQEFRETGKYSYPKKTSKKYMN